MVEAVGAAYRVRPGRRSGLTLCLTAAVAGSVNVVWSAWPNPSIARKKGLPSTWICEAVGALEARIEYVRCMVAAWRCVVFRVATMSRRSAVTLARCDDGERMRQCNCKLGEE